MVLLAASLKVRQNVGACLSSFPAKLPHGGAPCAARLPAHCSASSHVCATCDTHCVPTSGAGRRRPEHGCHRRRWHAEPSCGRQQRSRLPSGMSGDRRETRVTSAECAAEQLWQWAWRSRKGRRRRYAHVRLPTSRPGRSGARQVEEEARSAAGTSAQGAGGGEGVQRGGGVATTATTTGVAAAAAGAAASAGAHRGAAAARAGLEALVAKADEAEHDAPPKRRPSGHARPPPALSCPCLPPSRCARRAWIVDCGPAC